MAKVERKKIKLSVFQVETCCGVLGSPNKGVTLKEVKKVNEVIKTLRSPLPEMLSQPLAPETENGKTSDSNAMSEYRSALDVWVGKMKERNDVEVGYDLSTEDYAFIKTRLSSYSQFKTNDEIISKMVDLAEKFDI